MIDACLCGRPSGLVSANTRTMSATDAFVMNHLWPLITHSSPSRPAVVLMTVGSAPAWNGSVSANALEISPRMLGHSHRSFCASVAPCASSSMLPLSGACTPKIVIENMQRPMISDIKRQLQLAEARSTELRVEERTPQALLFHEALQVGLDHRPLFAGQLAHHRLERDELGVDERSHPLQLRFELWIGFEIPRHLGGPSF